MVTHTVYIDDSGTKEYSSDIQLYQSSGNTRYFVFGAVLISTANSGHLVTHIRDIKRHFFGQDNVEIKSNWLRIPKERNKRYLEKFSITDDQLNAFVEEYYNLIVETDLHLIAAVVDKKHMQQKYSKPWYAPAVAYEILLQRVVKECPTSNSVSVVIDDMTGATPKGNQYKDNLKNHHDRLRKQGSSLYRGLDFSPIAGKIKFVNSAHSTQVQVADVAAYNVYRQFFNYGDAWEARGHSLPTYNWLSKIIEKFRQGPNRRVQGYGIIKFPLMNRIEWILE